jgi:hypothetical protein
MTAVIEEAFPFNLSSQGRGGGVLARRAHEMI